MRVAVVGGSGDLGSAVSERLIAAGHTVVWLSRDPTRTASKAEALGVERVVRFVQEDAAGPWAEALADADAVALLAGSPISDRWSPRTQARIVASRVDLTRRVVDACQRIRLEAVAAGRDPRPATLVGISGIGVYGERGDALLSEGDPPGRDWLARVAALWEDQSMRAVTTGMRVVVLRMGLVLDDRGLVPRVALPMRLFAGGPVGSGRQWFPWIHRDDVAGVFLKAIESDSMSGAYNAVAPDQVTMAGFSKALGRVLDRPSWARVPEPVLRIVLGPGAPAMVMSQRADPSRLLATGFEFRFPALEPALRDVLGRPAA